MLETRNIAGNEVFPDANVEQWEGSEDSIELPRGALIENSEGGLVRIVFVAFDRLESILKPMDAAQMEADQSAANSNNGEKYKNDLFSSFFVVVLFVLFLCIFFCFLSPELKYNHHSIPCRCRII